MKDVAGYQASKTSAGWYLVSQSGCLRIEGRDRIAFLQRQTSNDVRLVEKGQPVLTVLTSPTARILDVLNVLPDGDALAVLTLPGRAGATLKFLRSRIFFMDEITVSDISSAIAQVDLFGPRAQAIAESPYPILPDPVIPAVAEGGPTGARNDAPGVLRIVEHLPGTGLGFRMTFPASGLPAVKTWLEQSGAHAVDEDTFQILRIEAGIPGTGELNESYTPLETGLGVAVSGSKGCYTGQEVLARQVTYEKITQTLCRLDLDGAAQPGERLLTADGTPAGNLTSVAESPDFGWIALGIVKRQHNETGTRLLVGKTGVTATLTGLST